MYVCVDICYMHFLHVFMWFCVWRQTCMNTHMAGTVYDWSWPMFSVHLEDIMQGDRNKPQPEGKERGHHGTAVSWGQFTSQMAPLRGSFAFVWEWVNWSPILVNSSCTMVRKITERANENGSVRKCKPGNQISKFNQLLAMTGPTSHL